MNIPWGALVTLTLYVIGSTIGFVWWMATVTEKLNTAISKLKEMNDSNHAYARKEDVARELGVIENNQEKMWEKLDKLKEKVDGGTKQGGLNG